MLVGSFRSRVLRWAGGCFVPGVATEFCHHPDDRPVAETHPPNYSMNVYLVNSLLLVAV